MRDKPQSDNGFQMAVKDRTFSSQKLYWIAQKGRSTKRSGASLWGSTGTGLRASSGNVTEWGLGSSWKRSDRLNFLKASFHREAEMTDSVSGEECDLICIGERVVETVGRNCPQRRKQSTNAREN